VVVPTYSTSLFMFWFTFLVDLLRTFDMSLESLNSLDLKNGNKDNISPSSNYSGKSSFFSFFSCCCYGNENLGSFTSYLFKTCGLH
jgi:hypothetical protein